MLVLRNWKLLTSDDLSLAVVPLRDQSLLMVPSMVEDIFGRVSDAGERVQSG